MMEQRNSPSHKANDADEDHMYRCSSLRSPPSSCCMNGGVGGFQCLFKASPIIQVHLFSSYKCTQFLTEQSAYVRVLCCSQLSCLKWSFSKYSGGMSCSSSLPLRCNRSKHLCTPKKKNTELFAYCELYYNFFKSWMMKIAELSIKGHCHLGINVCSTKEEVTSGEALR